VSLHAQFYKGKAILLYPPQWLNRAEQLANDMRDNKRRVCKGIGIDPAEGGDKTSMCAVDEYGVLDLVSRKTPDTDDIYNEAIAFIRKWGMLNSCGNVMFDRGGGGKQHADRLRKKGFPVKSVGFGEKPSIPIQRHRTLFADRVENAEERYVYVSLRGEMYHRLSLALDPGENPNGFAIPQEFGELRRQMCKIPKIFGPEGQILMLPKNRKPGAGKGQQTLVELIGHSPDELDSLVLAYHAMESKTNEIIAGAI